MLERDIERKLTEGVKTMGGMCLKLNSVSMTGLPDRLILLPGGKVFFAELKAPGKKPTQRQIYVHGQLRALGYSVYVIDSVEAVNVYLDVFRMLGGDKNEVYTP